MFKMLRSPERLYSVSMWLISLVFAGFLIGLGSKIIADIPRAEVSLSQEQFADKAVLAQLRAQQDGLQQELRKQAARQQTLQLAQQEAGSAYTAASGTFRNWLATRNVTANRSQDPEVIARTRALDQLKARQREADVAFEAAQRKQLELSQRSDEIRGRVNEVLDAARTQYEAAQHRQELIVFAYRLAFTLPLLALSGWLVLRKRGSGYWPLARGFVLASLFAFFFELVPYLPNYGGYVRYLVGIVGTMVVGHYAIRWMQAYLVRRREAEQQSALVRRATLDYEAALKKMAARLCPGCERAIMTTGDAEDNFCVHCGLNLYRRCTQCDKRMNAFFHNCANCGSTAASTPEPA